MRHLPTRCDHSESARSFLKRSMLTRSFISRLYFLLSYLFGWLGHCTQLSPPSARNRCASLDVSPCLFKTGRGALCVCDHLARNNTIPWGVQFDTGSRAKASELLRGRDRTLVHRARPATEQLKARAAESSVGFHPQCLQVTHVIAWC